MYNVAKLSNEQRDFIFTKYEYDFGLNKAIVEKDFWVTLLLDYLFNKSAFKEYFIFKGGTSLSKCFNLISRFSEDIDLILKWDCLTNDDPNKERSKTKQEEYNKKINILAQQFIKENLLPTLNKDLKQLIKSEFKAEIDPNDSQIINFYYPRLYNSSNASILPYIKIEIGPLAALEPTEIVTISPLIKKLNLSILKHVSFSIVTLSVARTFWEKITILHQEANRPEAYRMPSRYSRHYYDVYCIGHSKYKTIVINNLQMLKEVIRFKKKFYPRNWAKYEEAFPPTIKLLPPKYRYACLEEDYLNMCEMFYDDSYPNFDTLIDYLQQLEDEINKLFK